MNLASKSLEELRALQANYEQRIGDSGEHLTPWTALMLTNALREIRAEIRRRPTDNSSPHGD